MKRTNDFQTIRSEGGLLPPDLLRRVLAPKNAGAIGLMEKKKKRIPRQRSEDQERAFWSREDSTSYIDWSKAERLEEELRRLGSSRAG